MQRFRIEVGHDHKVKPGNIVGAIANETGLQSKQIGSINIQDDHSLVDLPADMPKALFMTLKKTRVMGQALNISSTTPVQDKKTKTKQRSKRNKDKGKPKRKI